MFKILHAENITSTAGLFGEIFCLPFGHKANGFQCANILIGDPKAEDVRSIFEPDGNTEFIKFDSSARWPHILKTLGIFSSNGQARKAGWDKDVEMGFDEAIFKKKRHIIFIFKASENRVKRFFRELLKRATK